MASRNTFGIWNSLAAAQAIVPGGGPIPINLTGFARQNSRPVKRVPECSRPELGVDDWRRRHPLKSRVPRGSISRTAPKASTPTPWQRSSRQPPLASPLRPRRGNISKFKIRMGHSAASSLNRIASINLRSAVVPRAIIEFVRASQATCIEPVESGGNSSLSAFVNS